MVPYNFPLLRCRMEDSRANTRDSFSPRVRVKKSSAPARQGDNDQPTNQTEMLYQTVIVASLLLGNASSFLAGQSGRVNESRRLLPSPPHLGPASGPEQSKAYKGCLGLSKEELKKASQFIDNMPKCEVIVGGNTVVSNTGGEESSDSLSDGDATSAESSSTEVTVYEEVDSTQTASTGDSGNANDQLVYDAVNDDDTITSSYGEVDNGDNIQTSVNNEEDSNVGDVEASNIDDQVSDAATGEYNAAANENGESPSPLQYFDMTDCGSFSSIWMFDLAITCANSTSLDSCDCTAAKLHIFYGDIDCVFDECPANCHVCDMCMKLTGCLPDSDDDTTELVLEEVGPIETVAAVPIALMGLTAALFGIQLVLFKMYWSRRAQPGGTLGAQLMDEQLV